MSLLALLLGVTTMVALGAMVMNGEEEDEAPEAPDVSDLPYTDLPFPGASALYLNTEQVDGDLSDYDPSETHLSVVVGTNWTGFSSPDRVMGSFELNEEGDLEVQAPEDEAILSGLDPAELGNFSVHFVSRFDDDSDGVIEEDELLASFNNASLSLGSDEGDQHAAEAGSDLFAVLDDLGNDTVIGNESAVLRVRTGEGDDIVDATEFQSNWDWDYVRAHDEGNASEGGFEGGAVDDEGHTARDDIFTYHQIVTGEGDDTVMLGEGAAAVILGSGADVLTTDGTDSVYVLSGGGDLIDLTGVSESGGANVIHSEGEDTLLGSENRDIFWGFGTDGSDIHGNGGDDRLHGGKGADSIDGGAGNDSVFGHFNYSGYYDANGDWQDSTSYDDVLDGAADTLNGGSGNDLIAGDALDVLSGGEGVDSFSVYWNGLDLEQGQAAEITDFDPATETLLVVVEENDLETPDEHFELETEVVDGDMIVSYQGHMMAILRGVTELPEGAVQGLTNYNPPY